MVGARITAHSQRRLLPSTHDFGVLAALILVCAAPSAYAQPLTTRQIKTLSNVELVKTVQEDLGALLTAPDRTNWSRLRRISYITFPTMALATQDQGICARQVIRFDYAPLSTSEPTEDQPLKLIKIEAHAQFHATGVAIRSQVGGLKTPGNASPLCADVVKGENIGWFDALTETDAFEEINALQETLSALKSGQQKFESCNVQSYSGLCSARNLTSILPGRLVGVEPCNVESGGVCLKFFFNSDLVVNMVASGSLETSSLHIISISVGSYTVVS